MKKLDKLLVLALLNSSGAAFAAVPSSIDPARYDFEIPTLFPKALPSTPQPAPKGPTPYAGREKKTRVKHVAPEIYCILESGELEAVASPYIGKKLSLEAFKALTGQLEQNSCHLPIETTENGLPPQKPKSEAFTLRHFEAQSTSACIMAYDNDIQKFATPYMGKLVTMRDIQRLALELEAFYKARGFPLSEVILASDQVRPKAGSVTLETRSGHVNKIVVKEGHPKLKAMVEDQFAPLKCYSPLQQHQYERYTWLAQDLPGMHPENSIEDNTDNPGQYTFSSIPHHEAYNVEGSFNNSGSRYQGPKQAQLKISFNTLFGRDQLTFKMATTQPRTRDLRFFSGSYFNILHNESLKIQADAKFNQIQPEGALGPLAIEGKAYQADASLSYYFWRSSRYTLGVKGGGYWVNDVVETSAFAQRNYYDRIRALYIEAQEFSHKPNGDTHFHAHFRGTFGQSCLDPSRPADLQSRPNAKPRFAKLSFEVDYLETLPADFSFKTYLTGAYGFSQLLVSEQFAFGGPKVGQAFDMAEITGDRGAAARFELRYDLAPTKVQKVQPFFAYDIGRAFNIDRVNYRPSITRSCKTVGLRLRYNENWDGQISFASPGIGKIDSTDSRSNRLLFAIYGRF